MKIHKINNIDVIKLGGSVENLTRRNYQNSRLLEQDNMPAPILTNFDFITDKYELKYNVDQRDFIDSGIAFRKMEKLICVIDPVQDLEIQDLEIQGLADKKIIVDTFSTISLDMNYKRYNLNNNDVENNIRTLYPNMTQQQPTYLNNLGFSFKEQSYPLMIKLYCRIDSLSNPLDQTNRSKLNQYESQFKNYYHKVLKKNISKLFTRFFNRRNDSTPAKLNKLRSKLKIFKLDDNELKFDENYSKLLKYDELKVFEVVLNDYNMKYRIFVDLYPNKSKFVINVIQQNLFDYIHLSYRYNYMFNNEYFKRDESLNLLFFVNFQKEYNDSYIKLLKDILKFCINITRLQSGDGGFSYYIINYNKYPELHPNYNKNIELYDTWCKTYMFTSMELLNEYKSHNERDEGRIRFNKVFEDIEFLDETGESKIYPFMFNVYNYSNMENIRNRNRIVPRIQNPRGQPVIPNYNQPRIPIQNDNNNDNEADLILFRFR